MDGRRIAWDQLWDGFPKKDLWRERSHKWRRMDLYDRLGIGCAGRCVATHYFSCAWSGFFFRGFRCRQFMLFDRDRNPFLPPFFYCYRSVSNWKILMMCSAPAAALWVAHFEASHLTADRWCWWRVEWIIERGSRYVLLLGTVLELHHDIEKHCPRLSALHVSKLTQGE